MLILPLRWITFVLLILASKSSRILSRILGYSVIGSVSSKRLSITWPYVLSPMNMSVSYATPLLLTYPFQGWNQYRLHLLISNNSNHFLVFQEWRLTKGHWMVCKLAKRQWRHHNLCPTLPTPGHHCSSCHLLVPLDDSGMSKQLFLTRRNYL